MRKSQRQPTSSVSSMISSTLPLYQVWVMPSRSLRITSAGGKAMSRNSTSPLRDRDFDLNFETGTLPHALIPGFEVLQWWPLDRKSMPEVHHGSRCDLGERQLGSGQVRPVLELVLDDRPGGQRLQPRRFDRRLITLFWSGPDQHSEQGRHRRPGSGELPVHPALDIRAGGGVARVQPFTVARRGEIAADGIRLPENQAVIVDCRHPTVWIHREIFGVAITAK